MRRTVDRANDAVFKDPKQSNVPQNYLDALDVIDEAFVTPNWQVIADQAQGRVGFRQNSHLIRSMQVALLCPMPLQSRHGRLPLLQNIFSTRHKTRFDLMSGLACHMCHLIQSCQATQILFKHWQVTAHL